MFSDGGVVSVADLECLLVNHGIEARDVVIYRHDDDAPNIFRWAGRGVGEEVVRGQLVLHLHYDSKHVVVSAEIALASRVVASQEPRDDATTTVPMMPVKQRLMLITSIARLVIEDLRDDPKNIPVVLAHLSDIVEIAETEGWPIAHRVALRHRLGKAAPMTTHERIAMIHVLARRTLDELRVDGGASDDVLERLRRIIELAVPVLMHPRGSKHRLR